VKQLQRLPARSSVPFFDPKISEAFVPIEHELPSNCPSILEVLANSEESTNFRQVDGVVRESELIVRCSMFSSKESFMKVSSDALCSLRGTLRKCPVTSPSEDGSETGRLTLRSPRTPSLTRDTKSQHSEERLLVSRTGCRARNGRQRTVLPWGSFPYDVLRRKQRPFAGITSPDYAAPSGFLNLLTRCSALALSALFHAESVLGVEALRGFPLPVAATAFTARCPQAFATPR